jgi:hypothetical protein
MPLFKLGHLVQMSLFESTKDAFREMNELSHTSIEKHRKIYGDVLSKLDDGPQERSMGTLMNESVILHGDHS